MFRTRWKQAKGSMRLKAYYFCKTKPSFNHQTIRRSISIKSRSTENDPSVQSITKDDVLANNIRHQLGAYVTPGTSFGIRKKKPRQQIEGYLRLSAGSNELQSVRSIFQQRSDRLSRLRTVELASAAKLTQYSFRERGVFFFA